MSKMLDRVSKLLNQAENAGTPEEAETFMAKAQEMATINGIDLAIARMHQAKKEKASEPEQRRVQINPHTRRFFRKQFIELAFAIAEVNDIEYLIGGSDTTLNCFGFPEDIDMLEALFAHLAVQMVVEADEALKRGEHREVRRVKVTEREEIAWGDRNWGGWNGKSQYYDDNPDDEVYVSQISDMSEEEFAAREQEAFQAARAAYEEAVRTGTEIYSSMARGGDYSGGYRKPVPPPAYREIPVLDADGKFTFEEKEVSRVDGRVFRGDFYEGFIVRMRGRLWEIRKQVEKDHGITREMSSETAVALRDKKEEVKKAYETHTASVRYIGTYKSSAETNRSSDYSGKARDAGKQSAERVPIDSGREVKK